MYRVILLTAENNPVAFKDLTMPRIMISLSKNEFYALVQLASDESRDPRDQVAYEIRQILERLGYLCKKNINLSDESAAKFNPPGDLNS